MLLSGDFPFLLYFWRLGGFFSEILSESCQKLSVSYRQRNTSQGYTHDPDVVRLEERQTELFLSAFSSSTIFLAAPSLPTATLISCPAVSISFLKGRYPLPCFHHVLLQGFILYCCSIHGPDNCPLPHPSGLQQPSSFFTLVSSPFYGQVEKQLGGTLLAGSPPYKRPPALGSCTWIPVIEHLGRVLQEAAWGHISLSSS